MIRGALAIVALTLAPIALDATSIHAQVPHDTLRIGLVVLDRARAPSIQHGAALGLAEASRTAAMFGLVVTVEDAPLRANDGPARLVEQLIDRGVAAIVAATDDPQCRGLAALARQRHVVLLDLDCSADAAVHDACARFVFHVRPTTLTLRRARGRLSRAPEMASTDTGSLALWHGTLRRFGAEQLNERFRRRFGSEMESSDWAAWVAIKILTEAALRGGSSIPRELARYLARADARFDGHKGQSLTFDPTTGELRQPLYLITRGTPSDTTGRVTAELSEDTVFGPPVGGARRDACRGLGAGEATS